MTAGEPTQIVVQDGRDLGYAAVPQIIIERLRERLAAGPLTRALSSSVLLASELNLAQLREGAAVWAPDKVTLGDRRQVARRPHQKPPANRAAGRA